ERLLRKEMELEERERELALQTKRLKNQGPKPYNFPPLWPVMYHNIDEEITDSNRVLVRNIFRSWLFTLGTLLLNSTSCFLILIAHAVGVNTGATDFGVGLVYTIFVGMASFFLWYRPVYNAFMKEKALYYYLFFVFNGFHIGFQFYMLAGIPGSGSGGLINMISMISDGKILAGVFCIITSALWACGGTLSLFLYNKVYSHYKLQGHTFNEAKS
ncbi:scamp-domain-containing protein, partial [Basidiobolus meristosporus CBS 931.73]